MNRVAAILRIFCPSRPLLGWWIALGYLASCSAEPPPLRGGTFPGFEEDVYPYTAQCTPPLTCPGRGCADNALGAPDGQTVDMGACSTLDLFFSGGTIETTPSTKTLPEDPDLAIHYGSLTGLSRVEASADGLAYSIVGYLTSDPNLLPTRTEKNGKNENCLAQIIGARALVYFNRCTTITNVSFIRIISDLTISGNSTIDAVEALTFCPWNDKACIFSP